MSRIKKSNIKKMKEIINTFPSEFSITPRNELYCNICHKNVKYKKNHYVESHRKSVKHQNNSSCKKFPLIHVNIQDDNSIYKSIVKTFLGANIPLYKLRNNNVINLFKKLKCPIPSETTARDMVKDLASEKIQEIKEIVKNNKIFIIIDETQIKNSKFVSVLIGCLKKPNISFLIKTVPIVSISSQTIVHIIDDCLKEFAIRREDILLLLSDAARYMTSCTETLKVMYPSVCHVTCLLHLLHNCCIKVKYSFPRVDNLISSVNAIVVKNRERRDAFSVLGLPPQPIVTRWGTWINATKYYTENFNEVKRIISNFVGNGILLENARNSVNNDQVEADLTAIENCYGVLGSTIEQFERKEMTIESAVKALELLRFGSDPISLRKYLDKRLNKNDASKIMNIEAKIPGLSPEDRSLLWNAQPTTIDVERSFSLLGKIFKKERNFKNENVNKYMILYYNSD